MTLERDRPRTVKLTGRTKWLIGGAVSGTIGSFLFGTLLWLADPEIVTAVIPATYGLDPAVPVGWAFHLVHGLVFGIIFGFLVTRQLVVSTLSADVETGFITAMGLTVRVTLAGVVYGLAIWASLPTVVLPIMDLVTGGPTGFPASSFEILVGHMLYGIVLGVIFATLVDVSTDT